MKYIITFLLGFSIAWFTSHYLYNQYVSPIPISNLAGYSFFYGCVQHGGHDECKVKAESFRNKIRQISIIVL
jgi:hypothetical protein